MGVFSVEAFALRVQALVSDDRALMERLIRFAQAHDLLKKNAERAQKLAQESNAALETYQRQVRTLEENLARADGWYVTLSFFIFILFLVALLYGSGALTQMPAASFFFLEQGGTSRAAIGREARARTARSRAGRDAAGADERKGGAVRARAAARAGRREGGEGAACDELGVGDGAGAEARAVRGDQPRPDGEWELAAAAARPWQVIAW